MKYNSASDLCKALKISRNDLTTYIQKAVPDQWELKKEYSKRYPMGMYQFTTEDYKLFYSIRNLRRENVPYKEIKKQMIAEFIPSIDTHSLACLVNFSEKDNEQEEVVEVEPSAELIKIENKKGQLLVSSREIARNFEKNHRDVLRDIDNKIESILTSAQDYAHLFIEHFYKDTYKRNQREYLLTRDGFSFMVMGFTGNKADIWKLQYIEAFNKMEEAIEEQVIPSNLSPELQMFNQMLKAMANTEMKQKELEESVIETNENINKVNENVEAIREVITINPKAEWRKETNNILAKIGKKIENYSKPRAEVYEALQHRASCRPNVLVNNLKKRALENGMAPSKADKLNILDVLENDTRLREIYITIVKEMSIKHRIA